MDHASPTRRDRSEPANELADADSSEQKQKGDRRQEQGRRGRKNIRPGRVETRIRADEGVGEEGGWEESAAEESGAPSSDRKADRPEEEYGEKNDSIPVAVAYEGPEKEGEHACTESQQELRPLRLTREGVAAQILALVRARASVPREGSVKEVRTYGRSCPPCRATGPRSYQEGSVAAQAK